MKSQEMSIHNFELTNFKPQDTLLRFYSEDDVIDFSTANLEIKIQFNRNPREIVGVILPYYWQGENFVNTEVCDVSYEVAANYATVMLYSDDASVDLTKIHAYSTRK